MKTFIILLLTSCAYLKAEETNSITCHVDQRLDMPDGVVVQSMETYRRGNDVVLITGRVRNTNSQMVVQSRTYIIHGDVAMSEMAVKRGNIQDALLIFGRLGSSSREVYRRRSDGTVKPASEALLKAVAARELLDQQLIQSGDTGPVKPEVEAKLKDVNRMMEEALKTDDKI